MSERTPDELAWQELAVFWAALAGSIVVSLAVLYAVGRLVVRWVAGLMRGIDQVEPIFLILVIVALLVLLIKVRRAKKVQEG